MGHFLGMKSRVHPKYKTKYRVSNWAEYDRALVRRGDITLWISEDAIEGWKPAPSASRGGPGTGLLGAYLSECLVSVVRKTQLVFPIPRPCLLTTMASKASPGEVAD
jgi:hypothetical protein